MRIKTLIAVAALSVMPTFAADSGVIEFPQGEVRVSIDETKAEAVFTHGKDIVRVQSAYLPSEYGRSGDLVLMFMPAGGSACPGMFTWLKLDAGRLTPSEVFGTCSDLIEVEKTEDGMLVSMPRMGGSGYSGFLLDGGLIEEIELGLKSAGIEDPTDAEAWAGRPVYDLLTAAEMEPHLLEIMSWKQLEAVRIAGTIYDDTFKEDNGWYVASGCRPHNCGFETAGAAINVKDGTLIVGYWNETDGGVLYGEPKSALPNEIRTLLRQGHP